MNRRRVKSPSLLGMRHKLSPTREQENDAYIEKADKILHKQKKHITNLKWSKEEILDEIQKVKTCTNDEKVKIRLANEVTEKLHKRIAKQKKITK